MRIEKDISRPPHVEIIVNGQPIRAFPGESVAAALFASGIYHLRSSCRLGDARGMYCLMGSCQECVVVIDGRRVESCRERVREGMIIEIEDGK
jgi:predicted molibdopterin-dependent oxidoreductase YjgC